MGFVAPGCCGRTSLTFKLPNDIDARRVSHTSAWGSNLVLLSLSGLYIAWKA